MRDQGTGRRADRPLGPPGESEHTTQPGPHDVQRVQLPAVVARERLRHDRDSEPAHHQLYQHVRVGRLERDPRRNPFRGEGVFERGTQSGALRQAHQRTLGEFGVTHMDMPATPERIWRTIQEGQAAKTAKAADRAIVKT